MLEWLKNQGGDVAIKWAKLPVALAGQKQKGKGEIDLFEKMLYNLIHRED